MHSRMSRLSCVGVRGKRPSPAERRNPSRHALSRTLQSHIQAGENAGFHAPAAIRGIAEGAFAQSQFKDHGCIDQLLFVFTRLPQRLDCTSTSTLRQRAGTQRH
jgi:hypothetical protein